MEKASHLTIVVLAVWATYVPVLNAQYGSSPASSSSSSCVNSLYPCLNYLNSTRNPPDSCCDPLKSMIESNPQCLCRMISTQGTFQAQLLGINISQVELLPERCGQRVNPLGCLQGSTRNSVHNSAVASSISMLMTLVSGALVMLMVL